MPEEANQVQSSVTTEQFFVGAEKEFAEYVAAWNKEGIEEYLIQRRIGWMFNPPAAPHFGGVWERSVRSCKKAMYARTFFQQVCVL